MAQEGCEESKGIVWEEIGAALMELYGEIEGWNGNCELVNGGTGGSLVLYGVNNSTAHVSKTSP